MSAIVALSFLGFAILGVPIAFALGLASLAATRLPVLPFRDLHPHG